MKDNSYIASFSFSAMHVRVPFINMQIDIIIGILGGIRLGS